MNINRVAALVSSTAVGIAVIFGLLVVGAPEEQRMLRLDEARLDDLQQLVRVIDDYWDDHAALPDALEQLVDGRRLSEVPADPATDAAYEYATTAGDAFRLCATFELASAQRTPDFWRHDPGHTCYQFEVGATKQPVSG